MTELPDSLSDDQVELLKAVHYGCPIMARKAPGSPWCENWFERIGDSAFWTTEQGACVEIASCPEHSATLTFVELLPWLTKEPTHD